VDSGVAVGPLIRATCTQHGPVTMSQGFVDVADDWLYCFEAAVMCVYGSTLSA